MKMYFAVICFGDDYCQKEHEKGIYGGIKINGKLPAICRLNLKLKGTVALGRSTISQEDAFKKIYEILGV